MRLVDADALELDADYDDGEYWAYSWTQVKNAPTIDPVRRGHWISIHPLQDNDSGAYMCSVCHTGDWDIKPTDKYCKFCGARMEINDSLRM